MQKNYWTWTLKILLVLYIVRQIWVLTEMRDRFTMIVLAGMLVILGLLIWYERKPVTKASCQGIKGVLLYITLFNLLNIALMYFQWTGLENDGESLRAVGNYQMDVLHDYLGTVLTVMSVVGAASSLMIWLRKRASRIVVLFYYGLWIVFEAGSRVLFGFGLLKRYPVEMLGSQLWDIAGRLILVLLVAEYLFTSDRARMTLDKPLLESRVKPVEES